MDLSIFAADHRTNGAWMAAEWVLDRAATRPAMAKSFGSHKALAALQDSAFSGMLYRL